MEEQLPSFFRILFGDFMNKLRIPGVDRFLWRYIVTIHIAAIGDVEVFFSDEVPILPSEKLLELSGEHVLFAEYLKWWVELMFRSPSVG